MDHPPMKTRPRSTTVLSLLAPLAVSAALFAMPLAAMVGASLGGGGRHYVGLLADFYYLSAFGVTFGTALLVTLVTLAAAYPLAYTYWQAGPRRRAWLLVLLLSPFYANVTVKVFGWMVLLPAWLRDSYWAIVLIDVHRSLPFAVLLLAAAMARIDAQVMESARVCGAAPLGVFRRIVMPLSLPGAVGAGILIFSLTSASFVVPLLVGGRAGSRFLPVLMYQQFTVARNWGLAAAMAVVLLATSTLTVVAANRLLRASAPGRLAEEGDGG
jgi:putative spermidine/putrescine transport system permease protein